LIFPASESLNHPGIDEATQAARDFYTKSLSERDKFILLRDISTIYASQIEENKEWIMDTIRKTEPDLEITADCVEFKMDLDTLLPVTLTNLQICAAYCLKRKLPPLARKLFSSTIF